MQCVDTATHLLFFPILILCLQVVYLHEISSVWESVVDDGRESDANTSTNTDLTTISNEEKSHAGVGGRGSVVR